MSHPENLSGGRELMVPSRLLYGVVPECILDTYRFWQDESVSPFGEDPSWAMRGYRRLRGYPLEEDGEFIMQIEFRGTGSWQHAMNPDPAAAQFPGAIEITGLPGRTVQVRRFAKSAVEREYRRLQKVPLFETPLPPSVFIYLS